MHLPPWQLCPRQASGCAAGCSCSAWYWLKTSVHQCCCATEDACMGPAHQRAHQRKGTKGHISSLPLRGWRGAAC